MFRDRGDRDAPGATRQRIGRPQQVKKLCRRLHQIAAGGEVQFGPGAIRAKAQPDLIALTCAGLQPHRRAGGVMREKLPGGAGLVGVTAECQRRADTGLQRLGRDAAGAQQNGRIKGEDRRFDPHFAGAAVQHRLDPARKARHHMLGPRRADLAGGVGRGPGQRPVKGPQEGAGDRMRGQADRDRAKARRDQFRQAGIRAQRQHEGQRAGPERLGHPPRLIAQHRIAGHGLEIGQMHDQRVETRAALRLIDPRHGPVIAGVAAKAIDRLGGKADQTARPQDIGGGCQPLGGGLQQAGFNVHSVTQRWGCRGRVLR